MRRITSTIIIGAIAITGGAALAGCSKSEATTLKVTESEWVVQPAPRSIDSGEVRITVDNVGSYEHEMVIVKGAASALPREADGSVNEDAAEGIVGEIGGVKAGRAKEKAFDLDAGSYTLFCNIVQDIDGTETSHYVKGMRATLVVK